MLQAKSKRSELTQDRMAGVALMADEEVQDSLGVNEGGSSNSGSKSAVLLTDRRIIHISGAGSNQRTSYAAIEDVSAVEITRQSVEGYSAFIWALLAFFVSAMLWRVIENQTLSIAAAAVVALMGIYLIVDRLWSRGEQALVFKVGGAEIQCVLKGSGDQSDAEALVTRLFELKDERSKPQYARDARAKTFSPR